MHSWWTPGDLRKIRSPGFSRAQKSRLLVCCRIAKRTRRVPRGLWWTYQSCQCKYCLWVGRLSQTGETFLSATHRCSHPWWLERGALPVMANTRIRWFDPNWYYSKPPRDENQFRSIYFYRSMSRHVEKWWNPWTFVVATNYRSCIRSMPAWFPNEWALVAWKMEVPAVFVVVRLLPRCQSRSGFRGFGNSMCLEWLS